MKSAAAAATELLSALSAETPPPTTTSSAPLSGSDHRQRIPLVQRLVIFPPSSLLQEGQITLNNAHLKSVQFCELASIQQVHVYEQDEYMFVEATRGSHMKLRDKENTTNYLENSNNLGVESKNKTVYLKKLCKQPVNSSQPRQRSLLNQSSSCLNQLLDSKQN